LRQNILIGIRSPGGTVLEVPRPEDLVEVPAVQEACFELTETNAHGATIAHRPSGQAPDGSRQLRYELHLRTAEGEIDATLLEATADARAANTGASASASGSVGASAAAAGSASDAASPPLAYDPAAQMVMADEDPNDMADEFNAAGSAANAIRAGPFMLDGSQSPSLSMMAGSYSPQFQGQPMSPSELPRARYGGGHEPGLLNCPPPWVLTLR